MNILQLPPHRLLVLGYLVLIVLGTGLLALPFCHHGDITWHDQLFIATSAVSTTGLTTINVAEHYTLAGQIVILLLIQVGGLGYMSLMSGTIVMVHGHLSREERELVRDDLDLPDNINLLTFLRNVIYFSALVEGVGAVALYVLFLVRGVESPLWQAIFHSISAFCTAGFSLFDQSLTRFADDPLVNLVVALIAFCGAIGFLALTDVRRTLLTSGRSLSFTSQMIWRFTLVMLLVAFGLLLAFEQLFQTLPFGERTLRAAFQALTALTTVGFNTVALDQLSAAGAWLLMMLMIFGASPAGTGGGIKSTTLCTLFAVIKSRVLGRKKVTLLGHSFSSERITFATANAGLYLVALALGFYVVLLVEGGRFPPLDVAFEVISALGTVGLSRGITADLSLGSRLAVLLLMLIGRVSTMTFALALTEEGGEPDQEESDGNESVASSDDEEETTAEAKGEAGR